MKIGSVVLELLHAFGRTDGGAILIGAFQGSERF
jgi:hypothetical protein